MPEEDCSASDQEDEETAKPHVYQTSLYARQKNVNTTFQLDRNELMVFIGVVPYMGVNIPPSIEAYWGTYTRVSQVPVSMS